MHTRIVKGKIPAALGTLLLCFAASSATAQSACERPEFNAEIPDGNSATEDQMNSAFEAVKDFVEKGDAYIICVEANMSRDRANVARNDILDQMEQVAARFNRQLRFFRRANS